MKLKGFIPAIFLVLAVACNGQDVCCYSQEKVDSLISVIETLQVENNQLLDINSNLSLQTTDLQIKSDSLALLLSNVSSFLLSDSLVFTQDNIALTIANDSVSVTVRKSGNQFNYQLVDGPNRITLLYNDNKWQQWFMYDTASWQQMNGTLK